MRPLLNTEQLKETLGPLAAAYELHASRHSGPRLDRQPVHTVYGGAHLFTVDTSRKMGQFALNHLREYAPDFIEFAHAFRLPGSSSLVTSGDVKTALLRAADRNVDSLKTGHAAGWLAASVYNRVINKLRLQPVEDFRIDFDDGFGIRTDAEEDAEVVRVAEEVANGMNDGVLPPFIGIRVKPFTSEYAERAVRTVDLFVGAVVRATGGELPDNFVVTLPKVAIPAQVSAFARALELIENSAGLPSGKLKIELMIETPTAIIGDGGRSVVSRLIQASNGRCTSVHFGVYNYTASLDLTASNQSVSHPACDFARSMMQVALAETGIWMSDSATNIVPVADRSSDQRSPSPQQAARTRESIHQAWRLAFDNTTRSLQNGFYQGWDLHPAQLPARYAAVYAFYLKSLDSSAYRLKAFVEKGAKANLVGDVFDDASTGQGLLNFFLRAVNCGAITIDEAAKTGLTMDELRSRSFEYIVAGRDLEDQAPVEAPQV
jgi:citrate lyase beta subunit